MLRRKGKPVRASFSVLNDRFFQYKSMLRFLNVCYNMLAKTNYIVFYNKREQ